MKTNPSLLLTLAVIATLPVSAAVLTTESFDYTASTAITGQTGGTGWRSPANPAWQGATGGTVATSGLSYTGINASYTAFSSSGLAGNYSANVRNDRFLAIDAAGAGINSQYADAGLRGTGNFIGGSTVTGTLWGSYLMSSTDFSLTQSIFNLGSSTGGTAASLRQAGGAGSALELTNTSGGGIGAVGTIPRASLSTTVPNLIVFRYEFNGASNDTFSVWLNPTSASDPANITTNTQADFALQSVELRNTQAANLIFDEVRFGTAFADVVPVPEPSSYALVGLGALGLVLRRRRAAN